MSSPRPWGTAAIVITVDGSDLIVRNVEGLVRKSLKAGDPIRVEGRKIVVELNDRGSADAAAAIAGRLRERLDDFHVDIEVMD